MVHVRCQILADIGQPNEIESLVTIGRAIGEGAINLNIELPRIGYLGLGIEMQYIGW